MIFTCSSVSTTEIEFLGYSLTSSVIVPIPASIKLSSSDVFFILSKNNVNIFAINEFKHSILSMGHRQTVQN